VPGALGLVSVLDPTITPGRLGPSARTKLSRTRAHEMRNDPLVSVIVPTYDRALLIRRTLCSIALQTYRPIELVVVDDGSSDGTKSVLGGLKGQLEADARLAIHLVAQTHRGAAAARNAGFRVSTGDLVMWHDSDDLMDKKKVECVVRRMKETNADMCANGFSFCRGRKLTVVASFVPPAEVGDAVAEFLDNSLHPSPAVWTYRREFLASGVAWDEALTGSEDYDFVARCIVRRPQIATVLQPLCYAVEHAGSRLTDRFFTVEHFQSLLTIHGRLIEALVTAGKFEHLRTQALLPVVNYAVQSYALSRETSGAFIDLYRRYGNAVAWGRNRLERYLWRRFGLAVCSVYWRSRHRVGFLAGALTGILRVEGWRPWLLSPRLEVAEAQFPGLLEERPRIGD
jgi:glycosyltransferase involved in cell wall biosynthesis